jgi:predicted peptidase
MTERRFFDIFKRYAPSAERRALLESATSCDVRLCRDPFRVEVDLSFDRRQDYHLLYAIEDEFSTDDNRYYVTGLSMGGFGTWDLLMRYPEVFAAGVPICGGADPSYAEVLKDVPIYTVHSTDDPTVPVIGTQAMVKALKEAGSLLIFYEELEGFGHGVWNWTAEQADIWEWLFTQNLSFR